MGRDWVYNLSSHSGAEGNRKRSKKRGGGDRNNSSTTTTSPSGCMNAVFQLFDFNHYFNFPFNSSSSSSTTTIDHHPPPLQGVVAPRNSLEMEDTFNIKAAVLSSSSSLNNPQSLQLPMGGIQIKTRVSTDQDMSSSSESAYTSGSPAGTKTPTLVARLMGLDLLPETSSPRPSSSSSTSNLSSSKSHLVYSKNRRGLPRHITNEANTGTRSLPETPRTSASSARRSDVDQRFSLQSNKENSQLSGHEFEFSKFLTAKINAAAGRQGEENMSPGHYAKQIVKQFKESVSRRVGRDITNTVENRSDQRRDQHVVLLKSKKPTSSSHDQKNSCSPKHKFSDVKSKSMSSTHSPKLCSSPLSPFADNQFESAIGPSNVKAQPVVVVEEKRIQQNNVGKKVSNDQKYNSRLLVPQSSDLIRTKQEESFVKSSTSSRPKPSRHIKIPDQKCRSTPLANVPTILTIKRATRLPHQQEGQRQQHKSSESQTKNSSRTGPPSPSCLSQISKCKQKGPKQTVPHLVTPCTNSSATTTGDHLRQYISKILERTGIHDSPAAVSITNWYSPSHPLDPAIFHHLRLSETSTLSQCQLVFDVADEILAGILKPYLNLKHWNNYQNGKTVMCLEHSLSGSQLINSVCGRIRSLPSADCRVLEDIDGLIGTDLSGSWERDAYEEEFGDGIVGDVEGDILDGLMHETLHILLVSVRLKLE
ncbi:hypothetical protein ACET3Z_014872 [Daucus carota]